MELEMPRVVGIVALHMNLDLHKNPAPLHKNPASEKGWLIPLLQLELPLDELIEERDGKRILAVTGLVDEPRLHDLRDDLTDVVRFERLEKE